ncbi:MAG: FlgB family protein [Pseudomonadota bacterium]
MSDMAEILRISQELARHASARQTEIARNVANADTPGYRAKDLVPFAEVYQSPATMPQRTTRPGHMTAPEPQSTAKMMLDSHAEPSPNGNTVSVETEMMKSAEVRQTHDMALAVYKNSLDLMRTAVGGRR